MKILMIGPSIKYAKGGMSTVIKEIKEDELMNELYDISYHASYIDGNSVVRLLYSIFAFFKSLFFCNGYDLLHVHVSMRGSVLRKGCYIRLARLLQKKIIIHVHGSEFIDYYHCLSSKRKGKVAELFRDADVVIALSNTWKQNLEKNIGLANCVVIENGVNTEKYHIENNDNEGYYFSFALLGRLCERKGVYDLIKAVHSIIDNCPNLRVYLAGDGNVNQVKELVSTYNLEKNIIVLGWLNDNEKIELLSKVSTIILPSYNEGLPMSIIEGMSCEKAIISTNVGSIPELIGSENGILINPGNIDELAKAIILLYGNRSLTGSYGKANRQRVERYYSMEIMHKKIMRLYNQYDK